jgi:hypothetical protein
MSDQHNWEMLKRGPSLWALRDDKTPYPVDDFNREWIDSQRRFRVVAQTDIGAAFISTVFLGVRQGLSDPPYLFETMVLDRDGEVLDEQRYRSWDEAERGHAGWVAKWQAMLTRPTLVTNSA